MPHADASLLPPGIETKSDFWHAVAEQLDALLEPHANWVTTLSNAASLVYHLLASFRSDEQAVNWCGFYLESSHFPGTRLPQRSDNAPVLLLGPFSGRPACQQIVALPGRGVCADAFASGATVLVEDVDKYPGHIACDADSRAELVVPLIAHGRTLGVMDLDAIAPASFDEEDRLGLERIVHIIVSRAEWDVA